MYAVVFEGLVGDPLLSDIGLDDVQLTPGPCVKKQDDFACDNTTTIPFSKVRQWKGGGNLDL